METETEGIISVERSVAAITWLRNFLAQNSSASDLKRIISGIEPTLTTILTIERLRTNLEARSTPLHATLHDASVRTAEYEALTKAFDRASTRSLRAKLDADAVAEATQLARICSALGLGPAKAAERTQRHAALSTLAGDFVAVQDRKAARECALAEAQAALRRATEELRRGRSVLADVTVDVEERRVRAEADRGRASRMDEKARQYEEKSLELREEVRASGVSRSMTHEAVSVRVEHLKGVEARLEEVKGKLEKYRGLPADMDVARQKVDALKEQIRSVDSEIQDAITSMAR